MSETLGAKRSYRAVRVRGVVVAAPPQATVQSLARESGIVLPARAASFLSLRASERLIDLLKTNRVALVDGPVSTPFARFPTKLPVDLVHVGWSAFAQRLAEDLIGGRMVAQRPCSARHRLALVWLQAITCRISNRWFSE